VSRRGVWELSTPRLEQLLVALSRRGADVVSALGLQFEGFDPAIASELGGLPGGAARLVVESVLADRAEHPRPELELVWTGRESGTTMTRDTNQVVREMFGRAHRCVTIAGFAFYEASTIFAPLCERAREHSLDIDFFIHVDGSGRNAAMSANNFFTYSWPWRDVTPRLYYDSRADTDDESSTMHAKCVVVDDAEVFITSANFTGRAQSHNIELGVLIRDDGFASRVSGQWRNTVSTGLFRRWNPV
jgi:phosphatidylserine/phosphatidylglycerophosphate/cardiolipin synthase-like enzyme